MGEFVKFLVGEGGILILILIFFFLNFFGGFCLVILLQFCLVAEKMWEKARKCEEWLFV